MLITPDGPTFLSEFIMSFSTRHIDYLTRSFLEELMQEPTDLKARIPDPSRVGFIRISSIPRIWERQKEMITTTRELMQDVIVGLRGMMTPILFLLLGEGNSVSIYIGTFPQSPSTQVRIDPKEISSVLTSAYPGIEFERDNDLNVKTFGHNDIGSKLSALEYAGIVTGIPTTKVGEDVVAVEQIDRLIRGLYGKQWAYLVVATPIMAREVTSAYNQVLVEIKTVMDAQARVATENPIASRYKLLLENYIKKLEVAKAQGAWETCCYILCSDQALLKQALGIVESVFGGSKSILDPVRTFVAHKAGSFAKSFGQIVTSAPGGPGKVQHPYKYMTGLSSADLTTFIHLPTYEMPGYFVKMYARFDVYPHVDDEKDTVEVGEVLDEGRPMGCQYNVELDRLNKHSLVVGATGSGKTNTIFHVLKQLWGMKIPFLVIEPAKTEYRKLLHSKELGSELQVFTLGDENTSPFRLNPFEILPRVSLQTHIDHLKSVFGASFPMWAPMPQVLERAIHEIYQDKGWRLVENTNPRGESRNAFPTLTDLYLKIDEVVERLGYEERVTMDVQAALKTRINSLRIGGKGLMLDVGKGIPIDRLLDRPTVLELEAVADDDEKALLIGLLLVFLQEHYQAKGLGEGTGLQHVTVVEEAHRLLTNVGRALDSEVANTRWKAVETFTNILSELRAYGVGFIIAEQIPAKLASDVIKNTNLKIMHRIVSEEDRGIVGGSMNLSPHGSKRVTSLPTGEALVFSEGDDSPFRVKVPYVKVKVETDGGDRDLVKEKMGGFWATLPEVYAPFDNCAYCKSPCRYKNVGGKIADNPGFQEMMGRFVLTLIVDPRNFFEYYRDLTAKIVELSGSTRDQQGVALCALIQATHRYFERRGGQYHWSYEETLKLKNLFVKIMHMTMVKDEFFTGQEFKAEEGEVFLKELASELQSLGNAYRELTVNAQPYSNVCPHICNDGTCLFRFGNQELTLKPGIVDRFEDVSPEDAIKEARLATRRVISEDVNSGSRERAALCFALLMAYEMWPHEPYERERFMEILSRHITSE